MEAKQIEQILDDEFLERLWKATTDEEIKMLLKEKGLQFSDKQIADLKNKFVSKLESEMLSTVSGGKKDVKGGALEGVWHGAVWTAGAAVLPGLIIGIIDAQQKKNQGMESIKKRALVVLRDTVATTAIVAPIGAAFGAGIGAGASALWGKDIQKERDDS